MLPTKHFQINATEAIELEIDKERLNEIKEKTKEDETMTEVMRKIREGITRDSKIALGLCEVRDDLLIYDKLI